MDQHRREGQAVSVPAIRKTPRLKRRGEIRL